MKTKTSLNYLICMGSFALLMTACGGNSSSNKEVTTCGDSAVRQSDNTWQVSQTDTRKCTVDISNNNNNDPNCGPNQVAVRVPKCSTTQYNDVSCIFNNNNNYNYANGTSGSFVAQNQPSYQNQNQQPYQNINYQYHTNSNTYGTTCVYKDGIDYSYGFVQPYNGYYYYSLWAYFSFYGQTGGSVQVTYGESPSDTGKGILGAVFGCALGGTIGSDSGNGLLGCGLGGLLGYGVGSNL